MTPIPPIPEDLLSELKGRVGKFIITGGRYLRYNNADQEALLEIFKEPFQRIAKLTAALNEKTLMHLAAESEVDELETENTRLKALVSDEELDSFLHNEGQNIIVARRNQARNRINALLTSRSIRTPPQEGQ